MTANPKKARIINNANFAIFFEESEDSIILGELLFNNKVILNNEEKDVTDIVKQQILLALRQINPNNKKFDTHLLSERANMMFNKALGLDGLGEEVLERGATDGPKKYS